MDSDLKFIHLSDLHLLPDGQMIRDIDVCVRLDAAVDCICADFGDADFCMVTGDLTDAGDADSFQQARRILDRLPFPWHAMLGNHDTRSSDTREALPNLPWHEDGSLQYSFATAVGQFIVLDSTAGGNIDRGVLDAGNLAFLHEQLGNAQTAGRDAFVFLHHAPVDIGIGWLDGIKLENPGELWEVLKDFSNIRHIFFGHIHRPTHGSWHAIPFSSVRTTAHQVALRLGDAGPDFIHEDPSFAVVLVAKHQVVIHDHVFTRSQLQGRAI